MRTKKPPPARVLSIAGSDCSGGAGVQADLKTMAALGAYGMSAITAMTIQNTKNIAHIEVLAPDMVRAQIRTIIDDIGVDAIKIGMLGNAFVAGIVADTLTGVKIPMVLDTVMQATRGGALLDEDGVAVLRSRLIPMAKLVTPNSDEAARLSGIPVTSLADMRRAAQIILALGPEAVLVKGGHVPGEKIHDILLWHHGEAVFESKRINTRHTHGTGCTLATAIAVFLAQGLGLNDAVRQARTYVHGAIKNAPGFGGGNGPLDHDWRHR